MLKHQPFSKDALLENLIEKFGMLTHFQNVTFEELTEHFINLNTALSVEGKSDLDGIKLAQKVKNLPDLP